MFKENFSESAGNNNVDITSSPEPTISHEERMRQLEEKFGNKSVESNELEVSKNGEKIRERYQTAKQLKDILQSDPYTIRAIIGKILEENPESKVCIQRDVKRGRFLVDAYSPELVERIKEKLGNQIKEGYQTISKLETVYKASPDTIKNTIQKLLIDNPELEVYIQKNARVGNGAPVDAYSPEFVEQITLNIGDKIKDGYLTASQLRSLLNTSIKTINIIVNELVLDNSELEIQIQKDIRRGPSITDAYSPELVEQIIEKLGVAIKEGYQTASQLQEVLQAGPEKIKEIVERILIENPEFEIHRQKNARLITGGGRAADSYSPQLVEYIKSKLGEVIKEGYQTASQLQEVLLANPETIKAVAKELLKENSGLESQIQKNARNGPAVADAYSPELVKQIKEKLGKQIKDGYQTAGQLKVILKSTPNTIRAIVEELLKENSGLESQIQKNARNGPAVADAYSPELVKQIKEKLGDQVKEGYQTASGLFVSLKTSKGMISLIVKELVKENPELESCIQREVRSGNSVPVDAYSPELVERIKEKLGNQVKEGYQTERQLRGVLQANGDTIKMVVNELLKENLELESLIQRSARNGPSVTVAYSPELVVMIREKLLEMAPKIVPANRGFSFQYSLEILLKLINNSNLFIEKSIKIKGMKGQHKPDLIHISEDNKKINIFDIKLQTTTQGIEKDTINYTNYIKEKYPEGGNLVFLCLNGPDFPKERVPGIDNVTVRYYHALDFIERLTDNSRNKFLLRFIAGKENDEISDITELTEEEIAKINEIKNQLLVLRDQVQGKEDKNTKVTPEELAQSSFALRKKLGSLAKKATKEELMKLDFKELMKF